MHGGSWGRSGAMVGLGLAALLLPGGTAAAHGPDKADATAHQRAHERSALLLQRKAKRWERMTPAVRRQTVRRQAERSRTFARATAGRRSRVGAWKGVPFDIPVYAIHSVVMPSGKVLLWGYPPSATGVGATTNSSDAWLWDPRDGRGEEAFTHVPPPMIDPDGDGPQGLVQAPIVCSGQSLLPNGDVLLTGGNHIWGHTLSDDEYLGNSGLNRVFTFDHVAEEWTEQPQMQAGRWYPTQVLLGDGRTLVLGGYTEDPPGDVYNDAFELVQETGPGTYEVVHRSEGDRRTALYPHLFTMPDGTVLLAGPDRGDSALVEVPAVDPPAWEELDHPRFDRLGGAAVLRPAGPGGSRRVTQVGGVGAHPPDQDGLRAATETTETIRAAGPDPRWADDVPLRVPRFYANTVLLPDRTMVTVGGGAGKSPAEGNYATRGLAARRVELLRPGADRSRLGPAQLENRTYHSTAVLLPDGRILSAGDEVHGPSGGPMPDTAEIYSPPYLFRGRRPAIRQAPEAVNWGDVFGVATRRGGRPAVVEAALVAPGAVTHSADMGQRVVPLEVARRHGTRGLDVVSPPDPNVAPPGYYMLFGLSKRGVPTVAEWVRLDAEAPGAPRLGAGA